MKRRERITPHAALCCLTLSHHTKPTLNHSRHLSIPQIFTGSAVNLRYSLHRVQTVLGLANTLRLDSKVTQFSRVSSQLLHTCLRNQDRVTMPKATQTGHIEPRLYAQNHAGLEHRRITDVQKRAFVNTLPKAVGDVMPPECG